MGGSVIIAIHNSFSSELAATNCNNVFRHTFVKVPRRHDDATYADVCSIISSIIASLNKENKIILLGNFNRPNTRFIVDKKDNRLLPVNLQDTIEFILISTFYDHDLR